jgi:hypothetical protein
MRAGDVLKNNIPVAGPFFFYFFYFLPTVLFEKAGTINYSIRLFFV